MHRGEVSSLGSGLGLGKDCNALVSGEEETRAALRGTNSLRRSASLVRESGAWSNFCCSSAVVTMGRPSFLSSLKHSSFFLPCKVGFALQSFSFCVSQWGVFVGVFWQPSTLVGILFASVFCNRISEMSAM